MKKEAYIKWVSVTEDVPDNDRPVLVTVYRVDEEDSPQVMVGKWNSMLNSWKVYEDDWTMNIYEVVAWMDEIEPYVDWSKVPVDTKVYVKDNFHVSGKQRHFARYENGKIYTWDYGRTSWSAESEDDVIPWKYAKLAKPEKL